MAGVKLAEHGVEQVSEVLLRRSGHTQGLILFAQCIPVLSVKLRVVKTIAQATPRFIKYLLALFVVVDRHPGRKRLAFQLLAIGFNGSNATS